MNNLHMFCVTYFKKRRLLPWQQNKIRGIGHIHQIIHKKYPC